MSTSTHCTATTAAGNPCKAWAVHGSDPPRCSAHGGSPTKKVGAPEGNENALKHGFYRPPDRELTTIEDIIADLAEKQLRLSSYINAHTAEADIEQLAHLLKIHGQNASRLGRLLRDKRALTGDAADGISGAIAQALDELGSELGTEL